MLTSGTGIVTRGALEEAPRDKAKCSRLPARGRLELPGAARIRASAADVAWSAVTVVHYTALLISVGNLEICIALLILLEVFRRP